MDFDLFKTILRRHEGCRLEPYQDTVGVWTVGYGHVTEDREPITQQTAEYLLNVDAEKAIDRCSLFIHGWDDLDDVRQIVLGSMAYNLGIAGLMRFVKLLAAVGQRDWYKAHKEMLESKWAKQVGGRADELADMMLTGVIKEGMLG